MNSENCISSSPFLSNICNILSSKGLSAKSGIDKNSSVVSVPDPSLSSILNLL